MIVELLVLLAWAKILATVVARQRHLTLHPIGLAAVNDEAHQHRGERQDQRHLDRRQALGVGEERAPAPAEQSQMADHHSGSIRNTWVDVISILPLPMLAKLRPSGPP